MKNFLIGKLGGYTAEEFEDATTSYEEVIDKLRIENDELQSKLPYHIKLKYGIENGLCIKETGFVRIEQGSSFKTTPNLPSDSWKVIAIIGSSGSGKQYLAKKLLNPENKKLLYFGYLEWEEYNGKQKNFNICSSFDYENVLFEKVDIQDTITLMFDNRLNEKESSIESTDFNSLKRIIENAISSGYSIIFADDFLKEITEKWSNEVKDLLWFANHEIMKKEINQKLIIILNTYYLNLYFDALDMELEKFIHHIILMSGCIREHNNARFIEQYINANSLHSYNQIEPFLTNTGDFIYFHKSCKS